jgi:hypothetical protein
MVVYADAYWARFEGRMRNLPVTDTDSDFRTRLVAAARESGEPAGPVVEYADVVHRLAVGLGAQVSDETLADVRRRNDEDRRRLLAEGVSPPLLGEPG